MTAEIEGKSIAHLSATIDKLLTVVPAVDDLDKHLREQLIAVRDAANHQGSNSTHWWKRMLQIFGNRMYEIRETAIEGQPQPAWIEQARALIDKAHA